MTLLKLNSEFSPGIESVEKKARLVVYKDGVENVCCKAPISHIAHFIPSDDVQLFKGRLQLHKSGAGLNIGVKGCNIGTIKVNDFINFLEQAKTVYI